MQNLQGRPVVGLRRGTVHNGADEGRYVELRRRRALRLQDLQGKPASCTGSNIYARSNVYVYLSTSHDLEMYNAILNFY